MTHKDKKFYKDNFDRDEKPKGKKRLAYNPVDYIDDDFLEDLDYTSYKFLKTIED